MTDEEALMTIGLLMHEARRNRGQHRKYAAEKMGVNYGTVSRLENGEGVGIATRATLSAVEAYYGWSQGVLTKIWNERDRFSFGDVTEDDVKPRPKSQLKALAKASELTDEELISELSFRFLMRDRRGDGGED